MSLFTDRLGIIVVTRRVTLYLTSKRYRLVNSHVVEPNGGGHRCCPLSGPTQVKHIYLGTQRGIDCTIALLVLISHKG